MFTPADRDALGYTSPSSTVDLCDQLEAELKQQQQSKHGRGRVVTPRVNGMAMLGIKWQHAHERGSGGKGRVAWATIVKRKNERL
jgi:hypothetical protein